MSNLDLDALLPDKAEVTIGGDTVLVNPPTLRTLFTIQKMANKLNDPTVQPTEADQLQTELTNELCLLAPGLEKHKLTLSQLLALCALIAEMASPKKADDAGGTVKPDPKATEA